LSFTISIIAQKPVLFEQLQFSSKLESQCFTHFNASKKIDTFAFFLTLDTLIATEQVAEKRHQLNLFLKELEQKISKKHPSTKKIVDIIFEETHKKFLKKYEENTSFDNIFKNGQYNCVTASALIMQVLKHFSIDYLIKETPNHIYLIADPKNSGILVESTDPQRGFFAPNDKFKSRFVGYLLEQKIVAEWEVEEKGVESIFDKYFYKNDNITVEELCAIHYFNAALEQREQKDYRRAYATIEKSMFLFPKALRSKMLIYSVFLEEIDNDIDKFLDFQNIERYTKAIGYLNNPQVNKASVEDFEKISKVVLHNKGKESYFEQVYLKFKEALTESPKEQRLLKFVYHFQKAAYYQILGNFNKSLKETEQALILEPENISMQSLYGSLLFYVVRNRTDNEQVLKEFAHTDSLFSSLTNNPYYRSVKLFVLMKQIEQLIENEDIKSAESYILKVEALSKNIAENELTVDAIGESYGSISGYYVRAGEYPKAKQWLEKGLTISPNNPTLKRKLDVLEESQKDIDEAMKDRGKYNSTKHSNKSDVYEIELKDFKNLKLPPPPPPPTKKKN
jgi:tetratricopeptide (TPR) repeat protein